MDKIHCHHCQTPLSECQPMKSYQTDRSCEAYEYLIDIMAKRQYRPFTVETLTASCREGMTKQFSGIPSLEAFVKEFIAIQFDLGVIAWARPGFYKNI